MGFWTRAAQLVRPVAVADSPAPRPEPAWPSLPVIQRVVTPIPPVADRAPFVASLRAHQNPSFLAPLAHLIDPDGPSGRIGGLVTPAAAVQRAAEHEPGLMRQWPQHSADGPVLRSTTQSARQPLPRSAPAFDLPAQRSVDDRSSTAPAGAPDVDPAPGALRHLPAHGAPMQVQRSLTAAAVSEPVFRTLPALTEGVAPQSPTVAGQPLSAQRDVPDAAPPEVESPDPAVPDAAVPEVESPDVANARGEDVSTVTPPVQRLVAADPPSGDRARHSAPQPPSRTAPDPPVQRTLQAPLPHAAAPTSQGSPPPSPAEQAHAPRPSAPTQVQRTTAPTPDDSAPSRPVDSTPFSPMTTPAASSPAANQPVASAPLIGTTPQRAPVQRAPVQRVSAQHSPAPATPVTTRPHVSAPHASGPLADKSPTSASSAPPEQARSEHAQPMSVQRIEASPAVKLGLGAPLERPPAPATRIETVSLQEWAAARAQPPTVQRAIPTHEPTGPAPADRHIEAVADAPIPAATSRIEFPASTTDAPTANPPVAQRLVGEPQQIATQTVTSAVDARGDTETEAHSTSRVSTAEPGRATAPAPTSTPRVQRFAQPEPAAAAPGVAAQDAGSIAVAAGIAHRDADGSVTFDTPATHGTSATHDTTVQRAVDVDEMTAAGAPEPTTQPATAAAPHPAPATANIEDLARRLYDPLAARLKAELRLDRERFGLVTDLYR